MEFEGPQEDAFKARNSMLYKQQEDEEKKAEELAEFGIDCYECQDRTMPNEMHAKADEQGYTQLVCKYCV